MKYKGFTFIEVMIVVAIVGLLVSIAVPNFILFQCKKKGENIGIDKITTKKLCDIDVRSTEAIRSGKVNIEYYLGSNNNEHNKIKEQNTEEQYKQKIKELEEQINNLNTDPTEDNVKRSWKD